jgi:hypothetical protein
MRWNSFSRSILFAAVAGLGLVPAMLLASRFVSQQTALCAYLTGIVALYLAVMAPRWAQGFRVGSVALVAGAGVAAMAPTLFWVAAGLALLLSVGRSVFLYQTKPGRAVVAEGGLALVGLGVAYLLIGPSWISVALALWAFLLVQSVFFLVGGVHERDPEADGRDPFDVARARVIEIVDRM